MKKNRFNDVIVAVVRRGPGRPGLVLGVACRNAPSMRRLLRAIAGTRLRIDFEPVIATAEPVFNAFTFARAAPPDNGLGDGVPPKRYPWLLGSPSSPPRRVLTKRGGVQALHVAVAAKGESIDGLVFLAPQTKDGTFPIESSENRQRTLSALLERACEEVATFDTTLSELLRNVSVDRDCQLQYAGPTITTAVAWKDAERYPLTRTRHVPVAPRRKATSEAAMARRIKAGEHVKYLTKDELAARAVYLEKHKGRVFGLVRVMEMNTIELPIGDIDSPDETLQQRLRACFGFPMQGHTTPGRWALPPHYDQPASYWLDYIEQHRRAMDPLGKCTASRAAEAAERIKTKRTVISGFTFWRKHIKRIEREYPISCATTSSYEKARRDFNNLIGVIPPLFLKGLAGVLPRRALLETKRGEKALQWDKEQAHARQEFNKSDAAKTVETAIGDETFMPSEVSPKYKEQREIGQQRPIATCEFGHDRCGFKDGGTCTQPSDVGGRYVDSVNGADDSWADGLERAEPDTSGSRDFDAHEEIPAEEDHHGEVDDE